MTSIDPKQMDHPNATLFDHAPFGRMVRAMTREGTTLKDTVIAVHVGNGNWVARPEVEPGVVSHARQVTGLRWRDFAMETVEEITGTNIIEDLR